MQLHGLIFKKLYLLKEDYKGWNTIWFYIHIFLSKIRRQIQKTYWFLPELCVSGVDWLKWCMRKLWHDKHMIDLKLHDFDYMVLLTGDDSTSCKCKIDTFYFM